MPAGMRLVFLSSGSSAAYEPSTYHVWSTFCCVMLIYCRCEGLHLCGLQMLSKPENCCGLKESEVLSLLNDVGMSIGFLCAACPFRRVC